MSTVLPSTPVDMYNRLNKSTLHVDDFFLIQMSQAFFQQKKITAQVISVKKGHLPGEL